MFDNLKVIELASVLAGPLVGSFFAELGARVLKIENKRSGGDVTRKWKLSVEDPKNPISAYYCAANFSKESIFLDLTDPTDYELLIDQIKEADIVISNFTSPTAQKLKIRFEDIKTYNPHLIFAELTGFGKEDSRPAYDVVLQAESGFMYMNGEPHRNPVKMPVALIDVLAAHHLKEAILVALIRRLETGLGKHIEISLYDCAIASLANQATNWLMAGHIPQPMGSLHPNIAPYGDMFKTKDGKYLVMAIGTDKQFETFCKIVDLSIIGFETNHQRLTKRAELHKVIEEIFAQENSLYWSKKISEIPFGFVNSLPEVFQDNRAEKMLIRDEIEGMNTVRVKTALI